jgi:DNA-binding MarR family transcriptional regulator
MASEQLEERILAYLSSRPGTPEHLEEALGVSTDELDPVLKGLQAKGWVSSSISAWYGDPASAITVITLTPAGRNEAERRETLSARSDEPVLLTRDELVTELRKRFGWTDQQMDLDPSLRGSRFYYYPSISAWLAASDDADGPR